MNLKQELKKHLNMDNIEKIRYYKESPYMKKRFKPEYIEEECWVYHKNRGNSGFLVTRSDWEQNKDLVIAEFN